MKYLYLILIALFFFSCHIKSLVTPDRLCKKTNKKIACEIYTCGKDYCTNDKKSCVYLLKWEHLARKKTKNRKKFEIFTNMIENCNSNGQVDFKNQWTHRFNFG
jgi:hypothetical protein